MYSFVKNIAMIQIKLPKSQRRKIKSKLFIDFEIMNKEKIGKLIEVLELLILKKLNS